MSKEITAVLFSLIQFIAFSQKDSNYNNWGYKGYAGGMFIHTGYVQGEKFWIIDSQCNVVEQQVIGVTFGLGGKMSIALHRCFRVGAEGYFSACNYGKDKNSCRISWGGFAFDFLYPVKKWSPFVGVTLGGGRATHLIFTERKQKTTTEVPAIYFSNALSIISPAVGVEFLASNRISLLLKLDYMFNILQKRNTYYPQGLRLYFGVQFYQKK
jgi:hypothetical protein